MATNMLDGLDADLQAKVDAELNHLAIPVQETNANATQPPPPTGSEPPPPTGSEPPPPTGSEPPPPPGSEIPPVQDAAKVKRNAVRYAKMNDLTVSHLLAFYKSLPREKFAANNDELQSLVDAWEDFLMENQDFKIPGYVQLIIANVVIFGIKGFGQDIMDKISGTKTVQQPPEEEQRPQRPQPPQQPPPPPPSAPEPDEQPTVTILHNNGQQSVVKYEHKNTGSKHCQLPGCNRAVTNKRKFCSHSHSAMWNNFKLRGIAIDKDKI